MIFPAVVADREPALHLSGSNRSWVSRGGRGGRKGGCVFVTLTSRDDGIVHMVNVTHIRRAWVGQSDGTVGMKVASKLTLSSSSATTRRRVGSCRSASVACPIPRSQNRKTLFVSSMPSPTPTPGKPRLTGWCMASRSWGPVPRGAPSGRFPARGDVRLWRLVTCRGATSS